MGCNVDGGWLTVNVQLVAPCDLKKRCYLVISRKVKLLTIPAGQKSHSSIHTYMNFRFKNFAKRFYQHTKFRVVTKIVAAVREHTMKEKLSVCT